MSRIQKCIAMICIITVTFLTTSPFTSQTAADHWSDCDGRGAPYRYGFDACVAAHQSAFNACVPYYDCVDAAPPWWVLAFVGLSVDEICEDLEETCRAAQAVASDMCVCDS